MLPNAIVAAVQYNVFGQATPPAAVTAKIQQCVTEACEYVQNRANWFWLLSRQSVASVVGDMDYSLPTNYKETVSLFYKANGATTYNRLSRITMKEVQEQRLETTQGTPVYYCIVGDYFELYPIPDYAPANPTTNIIHNYYLRIAAPDYATNTADVMCTNAGEAITALATSKLAKAYDYYSKAETYEAEFTILLDALYARHHAHEMGDNRAPRYVDL